MSEKTKLPFLGRVLAKVKSYRRRRDEEDADPFRPIENEAEMFAAAAVSLDTPLLRTIVHLLRAQREEVQQMLDGMATHEGGADVIRGLLGESAALARAVRNIRGFVEEANKQIRLEREREVTE